MSRGPDSITTSAQLAALKRRVRSGAYVVDPAAVAETMVTRMATHRRSNCLIQIGRGR